MKAMTRMQQDGVETLPEHAGPREGEARLAADCLTIWQSELAALAADPELCELRAALEALWRPDASTP